MAVVLAVGALVVSLYAIVEAGTLFTTQTDDQLLAAVPRRRTGRGSLDADALPEALAVQLEQVAAVTARSGVPATRREIRTRNRARTMHAADGCRSTALGPRSVT